MVQDCVICGDKTSTLHILQRKEELKKNQLEFDFGTSLINLKLSYFFI